MSRFGYIITNIAVGTSASVGGIALLGTSGLCSLAHIAVRSVILGNVVSARSLVPMTAVIIRERSLKAMTRCSGIVILIGLAAITGIRSEALLGTTGSRQHALVIVRYVILLHVGMTASGCVVVSLIVIREYTLIAVGVTDLLLGNVTASRTMLVVLLGSRIEVPGVLGELTVLLAAYRASSLLLTGCHSARVLGPCSCNNLRAGRTGDSSSAITVIRARRMTESLTFG